MIEPFKPEALEALKERFKKSLIESYSTARVIEKPEDRPGAKRCHIFDFEDGIRLIVSRDIVGSEEVIHFSASINSEIYSEPADVYLYNKMKRHFFTLYGSMPPVYFVGFTNKGIPHWYIKNINLN